MQYPARVTQLMTSTSPLFFHTVGDKFSNDRLLLTDFSRHNSKSVCCLLSLQCCAERNRVLVVIATYLGWLAYYIPAEASASATKSREQHP